MNSLALLLDSSVGKKIVMAITGVALLGFVVGHMIGNLQIFLPPEAINRYAHFLQSNQALLWSVRLGLLTCVTLHVWCAIRLTRENRAARPQVYDRDPALTTSSYASRTMLMSGVIIACFVIYHLLHFTVRIESLNGSSIQFHDLRDPITGHQDVYAMMVAGFGVWYVSAFYLVAMGLLCLHLSHGVSAMFQSVGLMNRSWRGVIERSAWIVAVGLFCGYASIPAAIFLLGHGQAHLAAATQEAGLQASHSSVTP
jgi:succinate dehydrogenase / fumarate reductase cytochrome b subunit